MTGQEFMQWMEDHDCYRGEIIEGFVGFAVIYRRRNTSLFTYFSGPFDDRHVPGRDIRDACDALGIDRPPGF